MNEHPYQVQVLTHAGEFCTVVDANTREYAQEWAKKYADSALGYGREGVRVVRLQEDGSTVTWKLSERTGRLLASYSVSQAETDHFLASHFAVIPVGF